MSPTLTILLTVFFIMTDVVISSDVSFGYGYESDRTVLLKKRAKRGIDDDNSEDIEEAFRIPHDVEIKKDVIDHQYYIMEIYSNKSDMINDYYINIGEMLKKPNSVGNISHPILSNSYRRAVPAAIQFDFPFYGHRMRNLTIATGGFVYVGDQSHSWLAATQYIAPLMANFDTLHEKSVIMYADDGEKFVIEWKNLQLREQRSDGVFTFQLSLHKNGDIWFVYKSIPISVANISDSHHPVKMGMSDAYLLHHNIHSSDSFSAYQSTIKRVIYEYHRIEVRPSAVVSDTIVLLKAQPTCIQYKKCDECANATLKHFNCSWCHSKAKYGGPFCSDQIGLHRRRQQWIESNCKDSGKITYCDPNEDFNEIEDTEETFGTTDPGSTQSTGLPMEPDQVVPWDKNKSSDAQADQDFNEMGRKSKQGYVYLFIAAAGIAMLLCWVTYAYYNPHTSSGQFLIKYRPSRWHIPSSHVRYSASVHM